jgi:peptidyl-prolyl cis-trans isomerase SurA
MKKIITLLIIILCFAGFQNLARAELLDRIVAVVNDEPITQSELDILLRPIYDEYKMEFRGEELVTQLNEVRQKLLSQLIEDRLVFQKAKELGIEADAMMIDQKINTFQERFGNAIEMEDALRSQGYFLARDQRTL